MKISIKSVLSIVALCSIAYAYPGQNSGADVAKQFLASDQLLHITGIKTKNQDWSRWNGKYDQQTKRAILVNQDTKKAIYFDKVNAFSPNDPKYSSGSLIKFATMPDPDGNDDMFSSHLTLFSQNDPKFILLGEEETK